MIRCASMLTMDAIDHPMMKDFYESGDVKRSVIIITQQRLQAWLNWRNPNIQPFVEGVFVEEFICQHVPKENMIKLSPKLNGFK